MSNQTEKQNTSTGKSIKLAGVFAFKEGMATLFDDKGEAVPVTILRYEPWVVTQIKTKEKDGYQSVQIGCGPKKAKNSLKSQKGHLAKTGFENGVKYLKEIKTAAATDISVGDKISIDSLAKGDLVKITATSKGHGFAGSVKRFSFAGGPAAHGSKFHRRPGSSGNRTWPGRVMPGKRFPGHYGDENITVKNLEVVDVNQTENVIILKGAVPGARNALVKLVKE